MVNLCVCELHVFVYIYMFEYVEIHALKLMKTIIVILPPYSVRQGLSAKTSAHQYGWSSWAAALGPFLFLFWGYSGR